MPLTLFQVVVLQYVEPAMTVMAMMMAFQNPLKFLQSVFYLRPDEKFAQSIADHPLGRMLIKYAGCLTAMFGLALYVICASGDDAAMTKFFCIVIIGDCYFMYALTSFASQPPGQMGQDFVVGSVVSVLVFLARVSFLWQKLFSTTK